MFEEELKIVEQIKEVHRLDNEGKIHLRIQVIMAIKIILMLGAGFLVAYDAIFHQIAWFFPALIAVAFFILGRHMSYRINKVEKDTHKGVINLSSMDFGSILIIGLYLLFRYKSRTIFGVFDHYATASVLSLASVAGAAAGRLVGLVNNIYYAHKEEAHPNL